MCGLFGVLALQGQSLDYPESQLVTALKLIKHRGPDHLGHSTKPHSFLAHARLAIIDLDPRSHQPMRDRTGDRELVFNGEIYNFRKLREELTQSGYSFQTSSDTEVILVGTEAWGLDGFLGRANGMFAFVLVDHRKQQAHFARDRMGEKPLFYRIHRHHLMFSSEMAPLMSLQPSELSASGLDAYLTLGFPLPQDHLVKGVRSVPPGEWMTVDVRSGKVETGNFWQIRSSKNDPLVHADVDGLEKQIIESVKSRMIADVPLCGYLSGGIDSSLIAAIASKNSPHPYRTYCIGYEGEEQHNEFEFARLVANKFRLDHHEIRISMSEAKDRLLSLVTQLDEPISNWVWLPLHFLTERARSDGYKVAMVGEGADEIFFGYNSMTKALRELEHAPSNVMIPALGLLANTLAPFAREGHKSYDRWRRLRAGQPDYMGTSFAFPQTQRSRVAGPRLLESGDPNAGYAFIQHIQNAESVTGADNVDLICITEIYAKMIEVLVRRVDRITMLHGLEARAPFLDHDLIEYAFRLPGKQRFLNGEKKGWLKQVALRHIPSDCVTRKKQGFSFPFKNWIHKDFRPLVQERFNESGLFTDQWVSRDFATSILQQHLAGKRDYSPQIWHLYTLAVWYDRWIKRTP